MNKEENIERILGFMRYLMHSVRVQDYRPWVQLKLTKEQLRVIFLLFHKGQSSPGEIALAFGVPKANVTSVIDRLLNKGLVSRHEDPSDRRRYLLSLTDKGKKMMVEHKNLIKGSFKDRLSYLTDEELRELLASLRKLRDILSKLQ